ncbi:MAG: hypothetical protein KC613_08940 [Myxococcales bacterium]|nr:hypothetical protein [Myxococcales bacterium]MCB9522575.1 hypothetical protein [Myxococcales bacterium]
MAQIPDFKLLWLGYPRGLSADVKPRIGGQVAYDWITNTCTIRMSRAFNYAGHRIPADHPGLATTRGGDGLRYAFRVAEFRPYLLETFGKPTISHEGEPGTIPTEPFAGRKGVICFEATFSDATGHFDMWNGLQTIGGNYFYKAHAVHLWEAPEGTVDLTIAQGVGLGQPNRSADVKTVQKLLNLGLADAGPEDGDCGPRTLHAIRTFQEWHDLPNDSYVLPGGVTWFRLTNP